MPNCELRAVNSAASHPATQNGHCRVAAITRFPQAFSWGRERISQELQWFREKVLCPQCPGTNMGRERFSTVSLAHWSLKQPCATYHSVRGPNFGLGMCLGEFSNVTGLLCRTWACKRPVCTPTTRRVHHNRDRLTCSLLLATGLGKAQAA